MSSATLPIAVFLLENPWTKQRCWAAAVKGTALVHFIFINISGIQAVLITKVGTFAHSESVKDTIREGERKMSVLWIARKGLKLYKCWKENSIYNRIVVELVVFIC